MKKSIKKLIALAITTITLMSTTIIPANAEWKQMNDGKWWNSKTDSWSVGWDLVEGKWYYFNSNGIMQTGWFKDVDGKYYFLQNDGSMAINVVVNGYKIDNQGVWIQQTSPTVDNNTQKNNETVDSKTTSDTQSNEKKSSNSNSSSSQATTNKNLFSVIFRLSDLHITGMAGGKQSLYGSKISTHGIIVADASDYNCKPIDIMESNWNNYEIQKNGDTYKLVKK